MARRPIHAEVAFGELLAAEDDLIPAGDRRRGAGISLTASDEMVEHSVADSERVAGPRSGPVH